MSFWLFEAITGSRLFLCVPLWLWIWWKAPRRAVLWKTLLIVWFVVTDKWDGPYAREHGWVTEAGFWLDHMGDFFFALAVVLSLYKSRDADRRPPKPPVERSRRPVPGDASPPAPVAPATTKDEASSPPPA